MCFTLTKKKTGFFRIGNRFCYCQILFTNMIEHKSPVHCKLANQKLVAASLAKALLLRSQYDAFLFFLSSWAGRIHQIQQPDWFLWAEFSHPERLSGWNPSTWSIGTFVNELGIIVNLSPFLHFHRLLISASLARKVTVNKFNWVEFIWLFSARRCNGA